MKSPELFVFVEVVFEILVQEVLLYQLNPLFLLGDHHEGHAKTFEFASLVHHNRSYFKVDI